MTQPYNRLLKARAMAGYRSGRAAAAAIGVKPATYASHENGTRTFSVPDAQSYADFFKVSAGWLLTGEALGGNDFFDSRFDTHPEPSARTGGRERLIADVTEAHILDFGKKMLEVAAQILPAAETDQDAGLQTIGEVVIHRMLNDDYPHEAEQWSIVAQWKLPKEYIAKNLKITSDQDAAIIVMIDDNMMPTCKIGDKLIVNFSQKKFTSDGMYVFLDENLGLHIQRVKRVNQSQLEISNDNSTENRKHPIGIVDEQRIEFVGLVRGNISTF
ncbi:MAG: helix-turn-helix domain-containing protein [Alphaproteobacteria bacterium]|nr:helix-turn-helix domain-containing protein [Alphaproteobacteria bacterium]